MLGIALGLSAALSWAIANIIARLGLQYLAPALGTLLSVLSSLGALFLVTIVLQPEAFNLSSAAILWFALAGILNFAGGRFLSFQSIRRIGVSRAVIVEAINPLIAVTLAVILLSETVTWPIALGTVAIVGGIMLVVSETP